jgi:hypothetical protein
MSNLRNGLKPIVTVLKQDLDKFPELFLPLSNLCEHVEQDVDSYGFYPKPKASMNLICLLLDKEIVYKLGFESIVDKKPSAER